MSKLLKLILLLIILQLAGQAGWVPAPAESQDTLLSQGGIKNYAIQIAASKVFIDPEYFRQKFKLSTEVHYFQKGGWYKYVIGSFPSESEAIGKLAGMDSGAFVTMAPIFVDSIPLPAVDSAALLLEQEARRAGYEQKIREADSLFNAVKDLPAARALYKQASALEPDRSYPEDQVIEIDKQLIQKRSESKFAKMPREVYIIAGFAVVLTLILVIGLLIRQKKIKRANRILTGKSESSEMIDSWKPEGLTLPETPVAGAAGGEAGIRNLIGEIMQLHPLLAGEISEKLMKAAPQDGTDAKYKKINSPLMQVRDVGFRELARENYLLVREEIERCLNSSNLILRMESELAFMRLNDHDPFGFLEKLKQPFTDWEQLHVYEYVRRCNLPEPDFSSWQKLSSDIHDDVQAASRRILEDMIRR